MPTRAPAWGWAAGVMGVVVVADRLTKGWVDSAIGRGESEDLFLGIDLVNVRNRGIAFGIFAEGRAPVLVFTGVALVALLAYFAAHAGRPGLWLPTGLLLGGALGNLIDRVRDDAVTDFVDLPLWPAFNLADTAITVGVLSLLYLVEARRDVWQRAGPDEDSRPGRGDPDGGERAGPDGDPRPA
ncbi:MAG: signal peptidase II [Solirubrobacteraceae bacterium]